MKGKKLFVIIGMVLCMGMFLFVGCGSSEESGSDEAGNDSAAAEESQYPMTVEDNDYFTFEITKYDDTWDEYTYKITNKLDKDIVFDGEKAIINGETTIDAFVYCDLAAGTSGTESFYLDDDQLADYEDGQELTLEVQYKIYDNDYEDVTSGNFDFTITK